MCYFIQHIHFRVQKEKEEPGTGLHKVVFEVLCVVKRSIRTARIGRIFVPRK